MPLDYEFPSEDKCHHSVGTARTDAMYFYRVYKVLY